MMDVVEVTSAERIVLSILINSLEAAPGLEPGKTVLQGTTKKKSKLLLILYMLESLQLTYLIDCLISPLLSYANPTDRIRSGRRSGR
jgi:hypothetical protein